MKKSISKLFSVIAALSIFVAFLAAMLGTSSLGRSEKITNITLENTNLILCDANDADISTIDYYTSYKKFYEAMVKNNENVKFSTVSTYSKRLYQEGVSRFENDGFEKLKIYRDYFVDFYEYWYRQSGMMDAVKTNISENRVTEINTIYLEIIELVDANNITDAKTKINTLGEMLDTDASVLDGLGLYAAVVVTESSEEEVIDSNAAYYLTYKKYVKATNPDGSKTITYTMVAEQIENLLNEGVRRIKAGEADFYKPFSNSYGYWYETSGFEKKTMAYISGARVTAVELQFAAMKSAASSGASADKVQVEVDKLVSMLDTDAAKLDKLLGYNGSSSGLAVATFVGCFTIIVREGLEAILILGAIIAYLIKSGNKKQTKYVYIGAVVAVVLSFALAILLYSISLTGISTAVPQEIIEGVTALIAVVVLIYVTNWMISKAESDAWTKYISSKVSDSASKGAVFTLAFTSFLAVFREGAEVILFYQPFVVSASDMSYGWLAVIGGFVLGLLIVGGVFAVIRIFGIKIPLKPFFMATSILMAAMAIIFLGAGIWELFIDGGLLAAWGWPSGIIEPIAWMSENDVLNFFGIYPTWWTIIPQIILTIITVITFVLWIKKSNKDKNASLDKEELENEEILNNEEAKEIEANDASNEEVENTSNKEVNDTSDESELENNSENDSDSAESNDEEAHQ